MADGKRRTSALERANLDVVEATILEPFVGRETDAVVVDVWKGGDGEIAMANPAVVAPCDGPLELGTTIRVRLIEADPATSTVRFCRV